MSRSSKLAQATALARHQHADEIMWTGERMIQHVLRIVDAVPDDPVTRIVATLHHFPASWINQPALDALAGVRGFDALRHLLVDERGRAYWWRLGLVENSHARLVAGACIDDQIAPRHIVHPNSPDLVRVALVAHEHRTLFRRSLAARSEAS